MAPWQAENILACPTINQSCAICQQVHIIFAAVLIDLVLTSLVLGTVSICGCKRAEYVGVGDLAVGCGASYWTIQDHTFHCLGLFSFHSPLCTIPCLLLPPSPVADQLCHEERHQFAERSHWIFTFPVRSLPCADILSLPHQDCL